ncbi:MAG: hypothetical protein JWR16_1956 [Nevskia sp.]|nr:hypothetical protein [Nevskia sp.]
MALLLFLLLLPPLILLLTLLLLTLLLALSILLLTLLLVLPLVLLLLLLTLTVLLLALLILLLPILLLTLLLQALLLVAIMVAIVVMVAIVIAVVAVVAIMRVVTTVAALLHKVFVALTAIVIPIAARAVPVARRRRMIFPTRTLAVERPVVIMRAPIAANYKTDDRETQLRAIQVDRNLLVLIRVFDIAAVDPAAKIPVGNIAVGIAADAAINLQRKAFTQLHHRRVIFTRSGIQVSAGGCHRLLRLRAGGKQHQRTGRHRHYYFHGPLLTATVTQNDLDWTSP